MFLQISLMFVKHRGQKELNSDKHCSVCTRKTGECYGTRRKKVLSFGFQSWFCITSKLWMSRAGLSASMPQLCEHAWLSSLRVMESSHRHAETKDRASMCSASGHKSPQSVYSPFWGQPSIFVQHCTIPVILLLMRHQYNASNASSL